MLPVCSAVPSCSSSSLITFHLDKKIISLVQKSSVKDKSFFRSKDSAHHCGLSFKTHAGRVFHLPTVESFDQAGPVHSSMFDCNPDEFNAIVSGLTNNLYVEPNKWLSSLQEINRSYLLGNIADNLTLGISTENDIEIPVTSNIDSQPPAGFSENALNLLVSSDQSSNMVAIQAPSGSESPSISIKSVVPENVASVSDSFGTANKGLSDMKSSLVNIVSNIQESLDTAYSSFTLSVNNNLRSVTHSVDNGIGKLFDSAENAKQQAGGKINVFTSDFGDNMHRAGTAAVDILRRAIISLDDSFESASAFVIYSYGSLKVLLPEEARNVLNISEEKAAAILKPVASALQQVEGVVEMFERSLGLDPNDPIVSFITLLFASTIISVSYRVLQYGGYSGDLSPDLTLEMLQNDDGTMLIDVRPEATREREGIPDLRRGSRFKYTSVTFPKVEGSARKLLKNVNKIDDASLAIVIRNLKIVQTGSKVIIMDACGERSKAIARSLRKFGLKRPYIVQGGFRSWVKSGLRIKQLKTETALTILNEEAEAILDDIKPTPTSVIGYVLAFCVASYSLLEWEKALQLIGIVGLGQTLYKRVGSYADSEDLKQDLRLLIAPVTLGAQAFSWAAEKLEPAKAGLPTSPSSTAVQDRVVQAAAKHGSQPSDADDVRSSPESIARSGENLDSVEA